MKPLPPFPFRRASLPVCAVALALLAPGAAGAQELDVQSSCLLAPSQEVDVGTPADGVLVEVHADRGATVREGQLLARLNDDAEKAAVDYMAAKVEYGERRLQRNMDLLRQRMVSSQELDDIETEVEMSRHELRERRELLALRRLTSPVSGVVVDRYRGRGDLVKQEKIFRIARLNPLYVEAVVGAERFGSFTVGQTRQVELPLLGRTVQAKVSVVDRVVDPGSGTFRVRLTLDNPDYAIPSGIRCRVAP